MLKRIQNYIFNEDAIDVSVQQILFIVLAVIAVVIVAAFTFSIMSNSKSQGDESLNEFNKIYSDLKNLK